MLVPIAKLVDEQRLSLIDAALRGAAFVYGKSSAVGSAARVKNNLQLPAQSAEAKRAVSVVLEALRANTKFQAASFPAAMTPPMFCKYQPGMGYGDHIDSPIMGGTPHLRCDIAVTIALANASTYEGGELVIDVAGVPQRWKGDAGDCILYPGRYPPPRRAGDARRALGGSILDSEPHPCAWSTANLVRYRRRSRVPRSTDAAFALRRKHSAVVHQLDSSVGRQPTGIARRAPPMKIIEIENAIPRLYQDQVELEATSSDIPWFYHRRERARRRRIR